MLVPLRLVVGVLMDLLFVLVYRLHVLLLNFNACLKLQLQLRNFPLKGFDFDVVTLRPMDFLELLDRLQLDFVGTLQRFDLLSQASVPLMQVRLVLELQTI